MGLTKILATATLMCSVSSTYNTTILLLAAKGFLWTIITNTAAILRYLSDANLSKIQWSASNGFAKRSTVYPLTVRQALGSCICGNRSVFTSFWRWTAFIASPKHYPRLPDA